MHYIAMCSGGKDSVATIILAREHKEPLDEVVFAEVMFDKNISGELPEHIDFVKNKLKKTCESWGYPFKIVKSDKTYLDCFYHVSSRGKRMGRIQGFPMSGRCAVNRDCKVKPIRDYLKTQHEELVQYIGIAADEPKRMKRLDGQTKISLLKKYNYTEKMAYELCEKYNLLSPVYKFTDRGGCWFCPNAKLCELRHLRMNYPEFFEKLLSLEEEAENNGYVATMFNTLTKTKIKTIDKMLSQKTIEDFICEVK